MKPVTSPHDLFFDQLREMLSMEIQLLEALPELHQLTGHPLLRDLVRDYLGHVDAHSAEIREIFIRFEVSPGNDKCNAMDGLLKGGGTHLTAVPHAFTRDLTMVAHCLRITSYAIAACEITRRLAERLGLLREMRTLGLILAREMRVADALLELEPEIFLLAFGSAGKIPQN